jgi:opacity protein-like surface antigen
MKSRTIAAALFALALSAAAAAAQPAKSLSEQIVGSWNFVVAEVTASDGKKSFPFGETPKGILIFTADAASPRSMSPPTRPKSPPTTA